MFDFNKKPEKTIEQIFTAAPQPLSEEMIRRDNYFHSCWMTMKAENPQLWEAMNKIELKTAGYLLGTPDLKEQDNEIIPDTIL